jgi:hypothetical protein
MTKNVGARNSAALLSVALALSVCGCIANRIYRPADTNSAKDKAIVVVPPQAALPTPKPAPTTPEKSCTEDESHLLARPCLAFLEFDDFGETRQKNTSGRPSQLNGILELIDKARRQDPDGQPLIVTFVHGWKHNASGVGDPGGEDTNILGLESAVNFLFQQYQDQKKPHVVIGVYIAWRGGLISPSWPVAQQFTYWNREATAIEVGNTGLTDALIEISDAAKQGIACDAKDLCAQSKDCSDLPKELEAGGPNTGSCTPILLFVGHSFGGLVMERALSQATVTRMEEEWNQENIRAMLAKQSAAGGQAARNAAAAASAQANAGANRVTITPLADLVIFINSAAAATESKQLMDYLASTGFVYRPSALCKGQAQECGENQPAILSVTSEADIDTGFVLKIGHALPLLGYKIDKSVRPKPDPAPKSNERTADYSRACFNPDKDVVSNPEASNQNPWRVSDLSQSDYYMSTTAHLQPLWSHLVCRLDDKGVPVTDICKANAGPGIVPYDTYTLNDTDGSPPAAAINSGVHLTKYWIIPVKDRCNGTPYWAMELPKEIVPDHNTIFTERLITFLQLFIPQPEEVGTYTRPQLTTPLSRQTTQLQAAAQ